MKKIMTLCLFAFALFIGSQTAFSQSIVQVNEAASAKTKELHKAVKFDGNTEELVYKTFQNYEKKKIRIANAEADGKTIPAEQKQKLEDWLIQNLKEIFTPDQFERYLTYSKSPK